MIPTPTRAGKFVLQTALTILVAPFFLVLFAAVQQSFQGAGPWENYLTVLRVPGLFGFFWNSVANKPARRATSSMCGWKTATVPPSSCRTLAYSPEAANAAMPRRR